MIHKTGLPLDNNLKGYEIELWCDGSADNQRRGRIAWGGVMVFRRGGVKEAVWYVWDMEPAGGTSPFAELKAIECVLSYLPPHEGSFITLITDSEWALKCISGEYTRNKFTETWAEVNKLMSGFDKIELKHVRGHQGVRENELCHFIADYVRRYGELDLKLLERMI